MTPTEIFYEKAFATMKEAVEPQALAWDIYEAMENAGDPREYAAYNHYLKLHAVLEDLRLKCQTAHAIHYADKYGPEYD